MIVFIIGLIAGIVLGWFIGPYFDRLTDWRKRKIKREKTW